ncbi:hypothetical protein SAMN02745131_01215 [Flavisolibacter ginsengisoli DSM 18119]|jgi:hypothetical protein|uniref:Uncharacterized protein n=1 Tax=Flavisolibacter ginsengisoli DSM 18119 TaxID=1121884 RepID=A0A1M4WTB1_9BACT|nr:hypothetical protein SAMN02745131_01215 [Flavisolibacter ginsengisoli DSM 18119]
MITNPNVEQPDPNELFKHIRPAAKEETLERIEDLLWALSDALLSDEQRIKFSEAYANRQSRRQSS